MKKKTVMVEKIFKISKREETIIRGPRVGKVKPRFSKKIY